MQMMSGVGRLVGSAGGVATASCAVDLSLTGRLQVMNGGLSLVVRHACGGRDLRCCLRTILHGRQCRIIVLFRHLVELPFFDTVLFWHLPKRDYLLQPLWQPPPGRPLPVPLRVA